MYKTDDIRGYYRLSDTIVKKFFKLSKTTPKMLISWMKKHTNEAFPCDQTPFKNKFRFLTNYYPKKCVIIADHLPIGATFGPDVNTKGNYKYVTIGAFETNNFWNLIRLNKKEMDAFCKYLKGLDI
jgi:hypothetical protein